MKDEKKSERKFNFCAYRAETNSNEHTNNSEVNVGVKDQKKNERKFNFCAYHVESNGNENINNSEETVGVKEDKKIDQKFDFCAYRSESNGKEHINNAEVNVDMTSMDTDEYFDKETDDIIGKMDLSMIEVTDNVNEDNFGKGRNNCDMEVDFSSFFDDIDDAELSNIDIDSIVKEHYSSKSSADGNVSSCVEGMDFESDD